MHFLLTGGSGFVGQNLARRIVSRGDSVTALVRRTSNRRELEKIGAQFAYGDLTTGEGLPEAIEQADVVLHVAGVTKARTPEEYHRGNADGTRRLMEAAARRDRPPKVVYCSSLSAAGPTTKNKPKREDDPPAPISTYGRSKLGGEQAVRDFAAKVPAVIVRPPIVYGPADREFIPNLLPMAKLGVVLKSGFGPKHYSLIHVDDLCEGLLAAADKGRPLSDSDSATGVYYVDDGRQYSWEEVCEVLARALGRRRSWIIPVPDAVSWAAAMGSQLQAMVRGTVPMLNLDKAREMRAEAWTCTSERARVEIGYAPSISLEDGLKQTIEWYRREGVL